jgi:hypothetical protein
MTTSAGAHRRHLATSPFREAPEPQIEQFSMSDTVCHDAYGVGRVISLEEAAVTVDFGTQKVRITSPFRKMTRL